MMIEKISAIPNSSTNLKHYRKDVEQNKTVPLKHNNISAKFNNSYVIPFLGKKDYTENEKAFFNLKRRLARNVHARTREMQIAYWNFYLDLTEENRQKTSLAFNQYMKVISDPEILTRLNDIKKKGIQDAKLKKDFEDLIKDYNDTSLDNDDIIRLQEVQDNIAIKFNNCVTEIEGIPTPQAQLILLSKNERNIERRKIIYNELELKASNLIANDLINLVKMRNTYAQNRGYKDFFSQELKETFQTNEDELFKLLENLTKGTDEVYARLSANRNKKLADAFQIEPKALMPYHYGFLTDSSPFIVADKYVKDNNAMMQASLSMYKKMGWDINELPILLDILPRENKNQMAFCFNIDTNKDVRILANLTNNIESIKYLNHELGHAAYELGISEHLPYAKREVVSPAMTEAIAMLMQSLPYREDTFIDDLKMPKELVKRLNILECESVIGFIRQLLLDINFEKQLYKNPDQDLPKLWYELEKKYLNRTIPDKLDNRWASVPHFLSHPAYCQNYLRGEIMASQIYDAAVQKLGLLTKNEKTADFLRKKIFRVGNLLTEDEIMKKISGKELNLDAFLNRIKNVGKYIH